MLPIVLEILPMLVVIEVVIWPPSWFIVVPTLWMIPVNWEKPLTNPALRDAPTLESEATTDERLEVITPTMDENELVIVLASDETLEAIELATPESVELIEPIMLEKPDDIAPVTPARLEASVEERPDIKPDNELVRPERVELIELGIFAMAVERPESTPDIEFIVDEMPPIILLTTPCTPETIGPITFEIAYSMLEIIQFAIWPRGSAIPPISQLIARCCKAESLSSG